MRFEGEEVKVVALGTSWVAAITSLNFLRIFTEGGLQMLEFSVFNISNGTQPHRRHLPLTPGSHLTWFGFSEEGQLSSYDSKGVLRFFTSQFGGSWLPLFSASKENKSENYWVGGLNASKLFCIVCKNSDLFPLVMPKPVLTLLNLSFPLASSDLGAEALENEFILNSMHLSQIQKQIDDLSGAGLDTTSLDDEAFNVEAAQDKCILRLIASCCNGDKHERATELVKILSLEKSVRGALKLVTVLKLPNLAERFNSIFEERLLAEGKETSQTLLPSSNGNVSNKDDIPKATSQGPKLEMEKTEKNLTATDDTGKANKAEEANNPAKVAELHQVPASRPFNPFTKSLNNQEKKAGDVDQVQSNRPSNPFFKSSVK